MQAKRTRSSLETYILRSSPQYILNIGYFTSAYYILKRFVYLTPLEVINNLTNETIWSNTYVQMVEKEAFVEIIMSSCLTSEISWEGLTIYVLNPEINTEKVYYKCLLKFLDSFFKKVEIKPIVLQQLINELKRASVDIQEPLCHLHDIIDQNYKYSLNSLRKVNNRQDNYQKEKTNFICGEKEYESLSMINYMANLRKLGMDIVFPSKNHDMLLVFIYGILRSSLCLKNLMIDINEEKRRQERNKILKDSIYSANPFQKDLIGNIETLETDPQLKQLHALTHKELIDFLTYYKKSSGSDILDNITKTKTRGVLALLKHADAIESFCPIGLSVQISISSKVETFDQFKSLHDQFLTKSAQKFKIKLTKIEWNSLIWNSPESNSKNVNKSNDFLEEISLFFNYFPGEIAEKIFSDIKEISESCSEGFHDQVTSYCSSLSELTISPEANSQGFMNFDTSYLTEETKQKNSPDKTFSECNNSLFYSYFDSSKPLWSMTPLNYTNDADKENFNPFTANNAPSSSSNIEQKSSLHFLDEHSQLFDIHNHSY